MSISRNATYNLLGAALPLVVTIVTVPLYLHVVGAERYGALALAWVVLGYVGFLDLGLGPAVSQKTASSGDNPALVRRIFWTAIWTSLGMGLAAAMLFYLGCWIYLSFAPPGGAMQREFEDAVPLLGLLLPVAMVGGVAGGVLHGLQRFLALNAIGSLSSTLMSLLPLVVAYLYEPNLSGLVAGAIAARAVGFVLLAWQCRRAVPLQRIEGLRLDLLKQLLTFGGWVTLSNAIAPLLTTVDRMAIGAYLGATAVAAYTIPLSLTSRLAILPASLASALYPRYAAGDEAEQQRLVLIAVAATAAVMTPLSVLMLAVVEPFFARWVGPQLATWSTPVAYALVIGAWTNSLAFIPATLLQGSGRPDVLSKVHLWEILPYWAVLVGSLSVFGLVGAAIALSIRNTGDCLLLYWRSGVGFAPLRALMVPFLLLGAAVATAGLLDGSMRHVSFAVVLAVTGIWSLRHMPEALRAQLKIFITYLPSRRGRPDQA